jgi:hypothetical protein
MKEGLTNFILSRNTWAAFLQELGNVNLQESR